MIGKPIEDSVPNNAVCYQGGFTYLWLLLFIAISSASVANLGELWQTQAQRAKEEDLEWRLQQFSAALDSYAKATPVGMPFQPLVLDELLEDSRSGSTLRHLRSLYLDPFTGKWDWLVTRGAGGAIISIKSTRILTFIVRKP